METKVKKRADAVILREILDVECALSPENLSCDGELSVAQQRATYKKLAPDWQRLIDELGRYPKINEVWPEPAGLRHKSTYGETLITEPGMSA